MFIVFEIEHIPASKHREALNTWLPLGTIAFRKEEDAWKYVKQFVDSKVDSYKNSYKIRKHCYKILNKRGILSSDITEESYMQSVLDISFADRSVEITEKKFGFRTEYLIVEYEVQ